MLGMVSLHGKALITKEENTLKVKETLKFGFLDTCIDLTDK